MKTTAVRSIQEVPIEEGLQPGPTDGWLGDKTWETV